MGEDVETLEPDAGCSRVETSLEVLKTDIESPHSPADLLLGMQLKQLEASQREICTPCL